MITADEVPEIEEISTRPISKGEVKNAISFLKNRKAGGVDNIVVELLKPDIKTTTQKLHEVIQMIWENEVMPHKWLKGLIVKLPKKGNLKECTNWRGITIASKVLGKILIGRLKSGVDKRLRAEQAGFRQGRNTTEQIFILRNIIEQTYEWQTPLVITGVKQGCVMSGFLFLLAIDWIMCETTKQANTGIRWRFMDQLEDLDFADFFFFFLN